MNRWVDEREWIQYQWEYLIALLGGKERIGQLAYETGAFVRRRKVDNPTDLLPLCRYNSPAAPTGISRRAA